MVPILHTALCSNRWLIFETPNSFFWDSCSECFNNALWPAVSAHLHAVHCVRKEIFPTSASHPRKSLFCKHKIVKIKWMEGTYVCAVTSYLTSSLSQFLRLHSPLFFISSWYLLSWPVRFCPPCSLFPASPSSVALSQYTVRYGYGYRKSITLAHTHLMTWNTLYHEFSIELIFHLWVDIYST